MPLTVQVARRKLKDWEAHRSKLLEDRAPLFISAKTLQHNPEDKVHEIHSFHVSAGMSHHLDTELLIYPVDEATSRTSHNSESLRSLQEAVIRDMMSITAPLQHEAILRFSSGMVYRFLSVDQLLTGRHLKAFKESYFYPTIAILGHSDFKMFSVTVCSTENTIVEAA